MSKPLDIALVRLLAHEVLSFLVNQFASTSMVEPHAFRLTNQDETLALDYLMNLNLVSEQDALVRKWFHVQPKVGLVTGPVEKSSKGVIVRLSPAVQVEIIRHGPQEFLIHKEPYFLR